MPRSSRPYARDAAYYDFVYHDLVDYGGDVAFVERVLHRWMARRPQHLLDLGCGTGSHDLLLTRRGYHVTGLDRSPAMLREARRKAREARLPVRFVQGDMRSIDLAGSFDAAVCMFGGFGYLTTAADVVRSFRSLRRHLAPDGLFVFEFWQSSGVRPSPYQGWFHRVGEDYELVRLSESRYDAKTRLLLLEFRYFVFREGRVLDQFQETHTILTHSVEGMRRLAARGGFDLLASFAATPRQKGFRPVRKDTFRVVVLARPASRAR